MVSRAQITRSRAAWNACEAIRADDQIGGYCPKPVTSVDHRTSAGSDRFQRRIADSAR
jgi:hypothetical protein